MEKKTVIQMLQADFARFHKESIEIEKSMEEMKQETSNYIAALLKQITQSGAAPLLAKTPKMPRKRATRIKAIPENSEVEIDTSTSNSSSARPSQVEMNELETSEATTGRSKRGASVKAADNIKKQQSLGLNIKLRRPSREDSDPLVEKKIVKESRSKRPKESLASSEDEDARPSKQMKVDKKSSKINVNETHDVINDSRQGFDENRTLESRRSKRTSTKRKLEEHNVNIDTTVTIERLSKQNLPNGEPAAKKANISKTSLSSRTDKDSKFINTLDRISEKSPSSSEKKTKIERTTRSSSLINAHAKNFQMNNVVNETVDTSNADETVTSMYEDAIGRPIPIMNSTMNPNSTVTLERMMNVTVSLEPLAGKKVLNETVTLKKGSFKEPFSRNNSSKGIPEGRINSKSSAATNLRFSNTKIKNISNADKFNELMTDDESSPERKETKVRKGKISNQQKRVTRSNNSLVSDDEVLQTPVKVAHQNKDFKSTIKASYKQSVLFSPYAKDSVKKRVEAFEQVAISPKQNENEVGGRVTRTKTRALAAASSFTEIPAQTVTQKLARKSLAKAKKISLAKQAREHDDMKENQDTNIVKTKKKSSSVTSQKSSSKTTPLGKNRMLQMPGSGTKNLFATPSNSNTLNAYSKPLTASRVNIVSNVDSFIQPPITKSAQKTIDRAAEEKRRRAHEEDVRRKREEMMKAQQEEKRRKREEKELKNKLAREAKEKLEQEKRLKAEREREEKAKLQLQMQEKLKEEHERKRIAHLQRAQEKEERRRQEELLRLQRLQEQEEQERLLAEQKRRELELEKRKQAETRQAELKMKSQMEKAVSLAKAKMAQKQVPCSYKIDSDPDEEESDDESKPKHQIPPWAMKHVRQSQLAMQQLIPMKLVLRFFDAKKCTPDLRELFQGIDPKKLKRSSSAIWKTPPRYSMMNCSIIKD